jgi:ribose transport system permease protein
MKKLAGIALFLAVLYALLLCAGEGASSYENHFRLGERIGLYGILTLAAGLVIVTGNIDLSMGSVIGLCATVLCLMLMSSVWIFGYKFDEGLDFRVALSIPDARVRFAIAIPTILALGVAIGLVNGLLVTYLRVQAFVVTLCGMFIYRGMARWAGNDQNTGLAGEFPEVRALLLGDFLGMPVAFVLLLGLLAAAVVLLHASVLGRYFYAIGSNERAARFSGISTNVYKILAFVLCSTLTALYSILYVFTYNSVQPSVTGNTDELYAIAGAVLGGFSLRGGEGTVLGILIGTCIIQVLPNMTEMWNVSNTLKPVVIGVALLLGATVDELLRRRRANRKA